MIVNNKTLLVILLCFFATSCVTKQKAVTKKELEASSSEKEIYVGKLNYEKNTTTFDVKDFANIFSNLKWYYQGGADDAFSVEIQQTEKGYKAEVKGAGTAEASVDYQSEIEALTCEINELYKKIEEFKRSENKQESSKEVKVDKTKEENNPWSLIAIIIVGFVVYLALVYIQNRLK